MRTVPAATLQSRPAPPWIGLAALWFVAVGLALIGLGDVPLRDFDEGTVARVALELSQGQGEAPLLPTLWGEPYLNKAPGLHSLIAIVIKLGGGTTQLPHEGLIRVVPALLSSLVVPLGGLLQWRLRLAERGSCLATSLLLLTLLPIARHGRLAMLDGTQLSAMALLWLALASLSGQRSDRYWGLTAGLMGSAMLLLKAPLLIPSAAAGIAAVAWGLEWRHWRFGAALGSLALGLLPGVAWHLWHGMNRGAQALWMWGGDGAGRVLLDAGEGSDLRWRVPLIELLEGGWPWLLLFAPALLWAWQQRRSRWGRWCLATLAVLAAAILPLKTQLPWYSHPLWLPFALVNAPLLAWLVERRDSSVPLRWWLRRIPSIWMLLGLLLVSVTALSFTAIGAPLVPFRWLVAAAGVGWGWGGWWLQSEALQQRQHGLVWMACGSVLALSLLFSTPLWLWELNERWPVEPVASLSRLSPAAPLRLKGYDERPSLNWYAGQRIRRGRSRDAGWFLTNKPGDQCVVAAQEGDWALAQCR